MCCFKEPGELGRDACFLATLQLQQNVLLGREVKVEGAVRDARGSHDRTHIGAGHARALELGDRCTEDAFPRLQAARFARRRLDLRRHGPLFVTYRLT